MPETAEVGRSLASVTCVDIDVTNNNVALTLIENDLSHLRFRLRNGQLQVTHTYTHTHARAYSYCVSFLDS